MASVACGDDTGGAGGGGDGGATSGSTTSASATTSATSTSGSTTSGSTTSGSTTGSTTSSSTSSTTSSATTTGSTSTGGGEDIEVACTGICSTLVELECVADVNACSTSCVAEAGSLCRTELIAYYDCEAENLEDCDIEPAVCADEGLALETCLAG